jgi:hypothetical protein
MSDPDPELCAASLALTSNKQIIKVDTVIAHKTLEDQLALRCCATMSPGELTTQYQA